MAVVNSLAVTHKPLTQILKKILYHQKRYFKASANDMIEKMAPPVQGGNTIIEQNLQGVSAISETSASTYHDTGKIIDSSPTIPNNPGLNASANNLHIVSGNPAVHSSLETPGPVVLRDLQVDLTSRDRKDLIQEHQNGLVDPTTVQQVFYFNTMDYVKKLEAKGFTRDQAEVSVDCLVEVINSTIDHQAKHMITKSQQEIVVQQLLAEITSVKKDMVLLQKSEFSSLRSETEKIGINMNRIETHFQDEVVKLKGLFSLDINLERGRAVEAHAQNEKSLQMLHNKIDTEIANLKTTFEIYRNDVIKFAGGTVLTCATLILGLIRLWK